MPLTSSVIIATANRPEPLRETLATLAAQTLLPDEVIVVDASEAPHTADLIRQLAPSFPVPLHCLPAAKKAAAAQRNQGADHAQGDLFFFLDDDLLIEPDFLHHVVQVFADDRSARVGAVSGTITNQTYGSPSRWTRLFLRLMAGEKCDSYAGRVIGPALNLLPADNGQPIQSVQWLPSTAVAYRADVFHRHRFGGFFTGYSFAEDLHLSARVAKTHLLFNSTRARVYHKDLGGATHRDWSELGRMQAVNRWIIMTDVLGRRAWTYRLKFLVALAFFSAADLISVCRHGALRQKTALLYGRCLGCLDIARGSLPL
ncbi:MAG: glycosyltransferase family 2 protein [Dehalococcoidia bacterium]